MNFERLVAALERDEGFRGQAYRDTEGVLTIGHGLNIDPEHGGGITEQESRLLLRSRAYRYFEELKRHVPNLEGRSAPVQEALANMHYNMGINRLLGFKKMLAAVEAGDYAKAADEALDSKWARQVGERANRIADLLRSAA